ncbi:transcriptional regulator Myc-like [Scomber japonicus]|uniref:transcriptional regulator Myc-like n=1 Tax=Scomber japonicus TaxID=13676 RepID=UPI00230571B7|nr:transcriptional regulator Myc-like [Scomber japonicus]
MPPVLTMNYDYDYDLVQPCFYLEEEDFYPPPRSQLLPGPSDDIWKKFELLPTPPLSPSRRPSLSDVPLTDHEHLELVTDALDEDCYPSAAFLQSFIIQDCMWSSSFAASTELEKVVSERLASLRARRDSNNNNKSSSSVSSRAADQQVSTEYLQDFHTVATDCIDPSVVFPYTALSEKSRDEAEAEVASEVVLDSPPISSSSDSESEEEEDEEEEEECVEEDEEIDVVTVDRRKSSRRCDVSSRPDVSPLVLKRSHINIHQHNYAAPQPSSSHQQPAGKRMKSEGTSSAPRQSGGRKCWSPASDGGDDGDNDRRRTHNVLERQRRNELRMSFLSLRDQVPAVAHNEKAAKVAILKKATEYIVELGEDEKRLRAMKDELRKRSRELKHKLQQLRTSH